MRVVGPTSRVQTVQRFWRGSPSDQKSHLNSSSAQSAIMAHTTASTATTLSPLGLWSSSRSMEAPQRATLISGGWLRSYHERILPANARRRAVSPVHAGPKPVTEQRHENGLVCSASGCRLRLEIEGRWSWQRAQAEASGDEEDRTTERF